MSGGIAKLYNKWRYSTLLITRACLAWFLWEVGTKPSRIVHHCQQMALSQVVLHFGPSAAPLLGVYHRCLCYIRRRELAKTGAIALIIITATGTPLSYDYFTENQLRAQGSGMADPGVGVHNHPEGAFMGFTAQPAAGHVYNYWDGAGNEAVAEIVSDVSGALESHHTFTPGQDAAGDWHVTVYTQSANPPTYSATDPDIIADDTSLTGGYAFNVAESAIPEFPTAFVVMAALALSVIIYLFMRRKAVRSAVLISTHRSVRSSNLGSSP